VRFRFGEGTLGPTSDEDVGATLALQRSAASSAFGEPILGAGEQLLGHFLKTVDKYLEAPDTGTG
jgi:hypothetical protein